MSLDLLNLSLAFFEGFALIISPCILPILPIILAGSLTGNKKRPLGIIVGFVATFALFTLFSRKLVEYSGVDLNIVRHLSYGILIIFGLIMVSTTLTEKFMRATQRLANFGGTLSFVNDSQSGFTSGIFFGSLVALIWTPCAGPILAAVIVQTVIQQTTWQSFLTLLAFAAGAAGPMFFVAIFGRRLMQKLSFFKSHSLFFHKLLGVIIILSVGYMLYFETSASFSSAATTQNKPSTALIKGLATPYPAPELRGITAWINSPPLQLSALKGKVVLIDFWTYSCINCIRTLPYLKAWYSKYHYKGLEIIGIHSPEFDFEKNVANVEAAVAEHHIKYPVALDNQFETWRNFMNSYWPAHYLIDQNGTIVYIHFGEGDYEVTENNIRFLLGLHTAASPATTDETHTAFSQTPETYLGYKRGTHFSSPELVVKNQAAHYSFPQILANSTWALQGTWTIMPDRIISAGNDAAIQLHFVARHVYMVMGSANHLPIHVKLLLNDKPLIAEKGKDVSGSAIDVEMNKLYDIVQLDAFGEGSLEIMPESPGLEVYTFTFGS